MSVFATDTYISLLIDITGHENSISMIHIYCNEKIHMIKNIYIRSNFVNSVKCCVES